MKPDLDIKLLVVDTSPLITLAAANSLDVLLYVENAELIIPDAVLYEATHDASRLGAADIIAWVKANRRRIEVAPTNSYFGRGHRGTGAPARQRARHPALRGGRTPSTVEKLAKHEAMVQETIQALLRRPGS